MGFRKVSYLIPACDGCGLAWSFGDPECADNIPPHYACRAAAWDQLPADYGWQIIPRRLGYPLMTCRRCSATGPVTGAASTGRLLAAARWVRHLMSVSADCSPPTALAPGHPESMTALLPPDLEHLLAVLDAEISRPVKGDHAMATRTASPTGRCPSWSGRQGRNDLHIRNMGESECVLVETLAELRPHAEADLPSPQIAISHRDWVGEDATSVVLSLGDAVQLTATLACPASGGVSGLVAWPMRVAR